MSELEEINNVAFELTNEELEPYEQYEKAKRIYELSLPIELNENQQIVLEWLKDYPTTDNGEPVLSIWYMLHLITKKTVEKKISFAYLKLTGKQQFEVLQAFAEWGLGHERD